MKIIHGIMHTLLLVHMCSYSMNEYTSFRATQDEESDELSCEECFVACLSCMLFKVDAQEQSTESWSLNYNQHSAVYIMPSWGGTRIQRIVVPKDPKSTDYLPKPLN